MQPSDLPRVDDVAAGLEAAHGLARPLAVALSRAAIDQARDDVVAGREADARKIAMELAGRVVSSRPRSVINATGVLLHTNLGRAVLPDSAADAASVMAGYGNVEIDLETGGRGKRGLYTRAQLAALTGADAALVLNNNAGGLLLALAALAGNGGRVAVSRGELIEIGGSFRLPELMRAGGVRLVEVGTTNRTRIADYAQVADAVDVFLKVHPSNYRLEGFTEEASWRELGALGADRHIPVVADVGSGLLDATTPWLDSRPSWLRDEPGMRQTLEDGATVVLASGDKLLGGPQAGLVVGSPAAVARMSAHPLARAMRCDGGTLAALTATLEMYAAGNALEIPFWRMAMLESSTIQDRSEAVVAAAGVGRVVPGAAVVGGGSVPGSAIDTPVIELPHMTRDLLLANEPPIVSTQRDATTVVNLRTVDPSSDEVVATAMAS